MWWNKVAAWRKGVTPFFDGGKKLAPVDTGAVFHCQHWVTQSLSSDPGKIRNLPGNALKVGVCVYWHLRSRSQSKECKSFLYKERMRPGIQKREKRCQRSIGILARGINDRDPLGSVTKVTSVLWAKSPWPTGNRTPISKQWSFLMCSSVLC